MESGYPSTDNFSQPENSYAADPIQLFQSQFFLETPHASTAAQSSDLSIGSDVPNFDFGHPCTALESTSPTPLINYGFFNTPVDISLGTLPPRPTNSRAISQGRIPRPRNAFMLFRSAFHREEKVNCLVEKDHRHISRIIAHCWKNLPEEKRNLWRHMAEVEKQQHAITYPHYRFKPNPRIKKPVKRNVKRNTPQEIQRCKNIAKLIIEEGKSGNELTDAVKKMESKSSGTSVEENTTSKIEEAKPVKKGKAHQYLRSASERHTQAPYYVPQRDVAHAPPAEPPFRSPLLSLIDASHLSSGRAYLEFSVEQPFQGQSTASDHHSGQSISNNMLFNEIYTAQDYMPRESSRTTRHRQRLLNQQDTLDWKLTNVSSYVNPDPKSQYVAPDVSSYFNFLPYTQQDPNVYPPTGGLLPDSAGWSSYYQDEATVNHLNPTNNSMCESWSKSNKSISPLHSNLPITPL